VSEFDLLADLERLAEKYRILTLLRVRREEAEAAGLSGFPPAEIADRTLAFRDVAEEFPGSLRELEVQSGNALRAKAGELEAQIALLRGDPRGPSSVRAPARSWMVIAVDYHATLRESLAVKFWLAQRLPRGRAITPAVFAEFENWHAAWPHRHGLLDPADAAFLEKHRRPPGGRIHNLVWGALSKRHGLTQTELETTLFGPAR